jgi:hypothetical protein
MSPTAASRRGGTNYPTVEEVVPDEGGASLSSDMEWAGGFSEVFSPQ